MSMSQRQAALQEAYEDWVAKIQAAREATEQVTAAMRRYNECLRAVERAAEQVRKEPGSRVLVPRTTIRITGGPYEVEEMRKHYAKERQS